ncbi:FMN-dependent dehydrogenase [Tirmania nivea]|nr:FMN-dependent dehydrogenase [Tirmania nivea]
MYHSVFSIDDLERAATDKMDRTTRGYFNSGAGGMVTLRDNINAFDRYKLRPRVLRDITHIDPSTAFLGKKIAFPLCIAPTAVQRMAHLDGELGSGKEVKGIAMGLSSFSTTPLEEVIAATNGIGDIDVVKNRTTSERLVRRAEKAGYKAIFLTQGMSRTVVLGKSLEEQAPLVNRDCRILGLQGRMAESMHWRGPDTSLGWENIKWLRSVTKLQIWLKGVLTEEDTNLAISHGVDGLLISNHGGRQLDSATSTLDALPECADGVWIGRIPIWGLVYDGQAGVELALRILYEEFVLCMALAGCRNVGEIGGGHLARVGLDGRVSRF